MAAIYWHKNSFYTRFRSCVKLQYIDFFFFFLQWQVEGKHAPFVCEGLYEVFPEIGQCHQCMNRWIPTCEAQLFLVHKQGHPPIYGNRKPNIMPSVHLDRNEDGSVQRAAGLQENPLCKVQAESAPLKDTRIPLNALHWTTTMTFSCLSEREGWSRRDAHTQDTRSPGGAGIPRTQWSTINMTQISVAQIGLQAFL